MEPWHIASGVVSLMGVFFLSWVVLHPDIHEGLIAKIGLIMMIFSLFVTAYLSLMGSLDWTGYWRAAFWLRFGLIVTFFGIVSRSLGWLGAPKRRVADWIKSFEESGHHDHRRHNT